LRIEDVWFVDEVDWYNINPFQ